MLDMAEGRKETTRQRDAPVTELARMVSASGFEVHTRESSSRDRGPLGLRVVAVKASFIFILHRVNGSSQRQSAFSNLESLRVPSALTHLLHQG